MNAAWAHVVVVVATHAHTLTFLENKLGAEFESRGVRFTERADVCVGGWESWLFSSGLLHSFASIKRFCTRLTSARFYMKGNPQGVFFFEYFINCWLEKMIGQFKFIDLTLINKNENLSRHDTSIIFSCFTYALGYAITNNWHTLWFPPCIDVFLFQHSILLQQPRVCDCDLNSWWN